jgi:hypothetical protein
MEIPEVRRRVRAAIEHARRDAKERRERSDASARAYGEFLGARAVPAFNTVAGALAGEGYRFKVFTPADSVRLSSEGSPENFIELELDSTEDPPVVVGRTNVGRGRRAITREQPVRRNTPVADLTEDHVIEFVLAEIPPLLER